MAAQVARAYAIFRIDVNVVYNNGQSQKGAHPRKLFEGDGYTGDFGLDHFLYRVLSFLETPPHLRKTFFPMHPDLETAGAVPSTFRTICVQEKRKTTEIIIEFTIYCYTTSWSSASW
jgi:predicted SPOUT superfamily RNA methylase MTH1